MGGRRKLALASGALALALVAAACGGSSSDSGDTATEATVDAGIQAGVKEQLPGTEDTGDDTDTTEADKAPAAQPTSIEGWEDLWADERAAMVERIKSEGWGKSADGTKLTGPEGFEIDLSACPADWSDTEGLTDTSIKIGGTSPLSGTAADFGNVARSSEVLFKYYGEQGLFKDSEGKTRTVNFTYKDDAYDPTRTIPLVDELLDSEKAFAIWIVGTPNGLKVYDKINERCVPMPLTIGGSPAWGDPENHPWTTGSLLSYGTEAVLWGAFIDQHIDELTADDGKATVAGFVANSEFGATYRSAFEAVLEQSPNKDKIDFVTEVVEITAPTVNDPMTTIASKKPDVFITMTGGAQCPQIINEATNNGLKNEAKYLFMSSVCKGASFVGKDKVGGDGTQSDGWYIVGGGLKDFNSEALAEEPFVKWARTFLADNGIDFKLSGNFGAGIYYGFGIGQALAVAGQLDGGLTRSNFILAQRSMDMTNPLLLEGIGFNQNGNADSYFVEGSDISVWNAAKQGWDQQGSIVELSGQTANCAWDLDAQACK
ncbi:MAG: ABC transporter substrate-binding protein [Acidimicrobiia bacterium]|nr:ABC transporter substrate-binding protein [Acidimicrobiia bacterium]